MMMATWRGSRAASSPVSPSAGALRMDAVVNPGKTVVTRLAVADEVGMNRSLPDLSAQAVKPNEVLPRPLPGIRDDRASRHDERPIAGLRQQEFAEGLIQRPLHEAGGRRMVTDQLRHPPRRPVQVPIHPGVRSLKPH